MLLEKSEFVLSVKWFPWLMKTLSHVKYCCAVSHPLPWSSSSGKWESLSNGLKIGSWPGFPVWAEGWKDGKPSRGCCAFCLSGISMYSIVVFKPRTYFILSKTSQLMFFSCKRCSFVLWKLLYSVSYHKVRVVRFIFIIFQHHRIHSSTIPRILFNN